MVYNLFLDCFRWLQIGYVIYVVVVRIRSFHLVLGCFGFRFFFLFSVDVGCSMLFTFFRLLWAFFLFSLFLDPLMLVNIG